MTTERRTPVRVVRVELMCECGGTMELATDANGLGTVFSTWPAKYLHECTQCGKRKMVTGSTYPRIEYEAIGAIDNA